MAHREQKKISFTKELEEYSLNVQPATGISKISRQFGFRVKKPEPRRLTDEYGNEVKGVDKWFENDKSELIGEEETIESNEDFNETEIEEYFDGVFDSSCFLPENRRAISHDWYKVFCSEIFNNFPTSGHQYTSNPIQARESRSQQPPPLIASPKSILKDPNSVDSTRKIKLHPHEVTFELDKGPFKGIKKGSIHARADNREANWPLSENRHISQTVSSPMGSHNKQIVYPLKSKTKEESEETSSILSDTIPAEGKVKAKKSNHKSPQRTVLNYPIKREIKNNIRQVFDDQNWKKKFEEQARAKIEEGRKLNQQLEESAERKKREKQNEELEKLRLFKNKPLNLQPLNSIDDVNFYKTQVDPVPDTKKPYLVINFTAIPQGQENETVAMMRQVQMRHPEGYTPRSNSKSIITTSVENSSIVGRERKRLDETEEYFKKLKAAGKSIPLRFDNKEMNDFMNRVMVNRLHHKDRRNISPELENEAKHMELKNRSLTNALNSSDIVNSRVEDESSDQREPTYGQILRQKLKKIKKDEEIPQDLVEEVEKEVLRLQKLRNEQTGFPLPLPDLDEDLDLDKNLFVEKSILESQLSPTKRKLINMEPALADPEEIQGKSTMEKLDYYQKLKLDSWLEKDLATSEVLDLGEGGKFQPGWSTYELPEALTDSTIVNIPDKRLVQISQKVDGLGVLSVREAANSRRVGNVIFINSRVDQKTTLPSLSQLHLSKTDDSMLPEVKRNISFRRNDSTASDYEAEYDEDGVRKDQNLKKKRKKTAYLFEAPKVINSEALTAQELLLRKKEQEAYFHRVYGTRPETTTEKLMRNAAGKKQETALIFKNSSLAESKQLSIETNRSKTEDIKKQPLPSNLKTGGPLALKKPKVTFADQVLDSKDEPRRKIIITKVT